MQQTTINRNWLIKMGIFFVALVGLGLWGLYDATIAYPARGRAYADFAEMQYLEKALGAGLANSEISVADPSAELGRLRQDRKRIEGDASTSGQDRRRAEWARLEWLTALARVGDLNPERTQFTRPSDRLASLQTALQTRSAPKPLSAYDIPVQWLFVIVGFGGAAWLLVLCARVAREKYRFDPSTLALTLPGGRTITPSDIREVDKRKWDKFFAFLQMKDGSPEIRLDLLRFKNLEDWVLEMEKQTEGYEPPKVEQEAPATA